jgi:hypothetical protein
MAPALAGRGVTKAGAIRKSQVHRVRRDPRDKLRDLANTGPDQFPVRLVFRLPKSLEGFVAPGAHGLGVQVLSGGYVRVGSHSSEQCFISAREFLATVARERPAFTSGAVIVKADDPDKSYERYLTVINGSVVVSSGLREPLVYEAA